VVFVADISAIWLMKRRFGLYERMALKALLTF
jgi:hypothetical protein